jgi:hypothetical protein
MPDLFGNTNLPFAEQVEFFRRKLNLPTERWDDIEHEAHDRSFVVAGATKADLLDDLRSAVDKAIEKGTGLEEFRRQFKEIVQKNGWSGWTGEDSEQGKAWRTRIIWETNLASSYAAGRYAQLTDPDLLARRPYWKYIHADGVMNPRPQHLAWNGMVLQHDHPFWESHYPPNGWGCGCRVTAVRSPKEGDKTAPPEGWDAINPKTGAPVGIDKGWAYTPGKSVANELHGIVEQKAGNLPAALANDFLAEVKEKTGLTPEASRLITNRIANTEGNAKKWLVRQGKETGNEHMVIYDTHTGKELGRFSSGLETRVGIPVNFSTMLDDRDEALALLHNHLNSLSLSPKDLEFLTRSGVVKVVAYGQDGSWFAATKGDYVAQLGKIMEKAKEKRDQQIALLFDRRLNTTGLEAHLMNLALNRAKVIRYEFKLDPIRGRLYTDESAALVFDAAVNEIVSAIERGLL